MTKAELYRHFMDEVIPSIQTLITVNQQEYAFGSDSAFQNFYDLASWLNISPQQVLLTLATKHWSAVVSHLHGHISTKEPIEGRIDDLITYLVIYRAMVKSH